MVLNFIGFGCVLATMSFGLTLNELKTVYKLQFGVFGKNEENTYYDQNGQIIFASKDLKGIGLSKTKNNSDLPCKIVIDDKEEERVIGWEDIADMIEGEIHQTITDDTMHGDPCERTIVYKAPFVKCDREEDYEIAWREFERRSL